MESFLNKSEKTPNKMEQNKIEKMNTDIIVPKNILDMYKISGYTDVAYEKYLNSKKLFESGTVNSGQNNEGPDSLLKTKNDILEKSGDQMVSAINDALQSINIEIQRIGASLIRNAPEGQRKYLEEIAFIKIIEGLNNSDIHIQRIAMNMVQFATENRRDELEEITSQKIIEGLNSSDVSNQRIMAKKINIAPENTQDKLREIVYQKIVEALGQEDIGIQRLAATMVQYAPSNKQASLINLVKDKFELAKQQGKSDQIIESPLYLKNKQDNASAFSHEDYSKTGSQTTLLLGKEFKNNLIIRHIEEPCFVAWKKAYESYPDWVAAGFDYIPIEPIYSFRADSNNKLINIISGVLDLNLEDWYAFSGEIFKEDLEIQKEKIIKTLIKLGINHGHPNNANFCLRFERDENGKGDISKTPKIYLIDFDKASQY